MNLQPFIIFLIHVHINEKTSPPTTSGKILAEYDRLKS